MHYLYLAIAIIAEVIATNALKSVEGFTKPLPILVCLVGYGAALFFLKATIESIPIGVAYAMWTGFGMILVTVVAFFVHKQKVDVAAVAGICLIVAGVAVINLFSQMKLPDGP